MKKKNYLNKAEQGVLIGTSFLLLNGVMSCSDTPMDTPPINTLMTKGPVGPPGQSIAYYPAGDVPSLLWANYRYGFMMTYDFFSFHTIIPAKYNSIRIKMENSTRKITAVTVSCGEGCTNVMWRQFGSEIVIYSMRPSIHNQPDMGAIFKIHSDNESPLVMTFNFEP